LVNELSNAVFLSYASQDAQVAQRLCAALRAQGIEVWIDQQELRGGEEWDAEIRKQIKACALFIALISRATQSRDEGYFRLEWKLAVDRSHQMSEHRAFLIPVVIDDTSGNEAVPERFREFQWIRLPSGEANAAFVQRIQRLLSPVSTDAVPAPHPPAAALPGRPGHARARRSVHLLILIAAIIAITVAAILLKKSLYRAKYDAQPQAAATIAVLPFADMSEKKDQEYFSDGLAEELLDLLAQHAELRVAARTSSFYFKGKQTTIPEIARTLGVAHVLEGSVRKSADTMRVTVQLIRADTGFHVWSKTYDRNLKDVFQVQDEIAAAVVSALVAKLSPTAPVTEANKVNPEAYVQYLVGSQIYRRGGVEDPQLAAVSFRKAVELDPTYADAFSALALTEQYSGRAGAIERGLADADRAIALAPAHAAGYNARAKIRRENLLDFKGAGEDVEMALKLAPGDGRVLNMYADQMAMQGRLSEAIAAGTKATAVDPLSDVSWTDLGLYLAESGEFDAAHRAIERSLALNPRSIIGKLNLAELQLLEGQPAKALTTFQGIEQNPWSLMGVSMAEYSLGHAAESQRALDALVKHENAPYVIAAAYAWRHQNDKAFEWLERAATQRDAALSDIKHDALLKNLHTDPRFGAFLHRLGLPE
jgi:TolB-like protein